MKISGQLMASLISARVCKKKMPWTLYYHEDLQWNTKKDWKSAIFNKREYASENVYNQRGEGICMRDYFFFIGVIFAFEDTDTVTYIICWLRRKNHWVPGKPCCDDLVNCWLASYLLPGCVRVCKKKCRELYIVLRTSNAMGPNGRTTFNIHRESINMAAVF